MKKKTTKPIAQHFMFAFEGKLERMKNSEDVFDISNDLEDIYIESDIEVIKKNDLPTEIPEGVRDHIVALSRQQAQIGRELEAMLSLLNTTAVRIAERKERAEEKAQPHCKSCKQPLPVKTKRRDR